MAKGERAPGELHEVRISGPRGRIALRSRDWMTFRCRIHKDAHHRLSAAFDQFCAGQARFLPQQMFHPVQSGVLERLEEFHAFGVSVIGRRTFEGRIATFFVTEISVTGDAGASPAPSEGPVQVALPLEENPAFRGTER